MEFKSQYAINELVEYEPRISGAIENSFGLVASIRFHQSDAVNHAATYTILKVNSQNVDSDVPEHEILKSYGVRRP